MSLSEISVDVCFRWKLSSFEFIPLLCCVFFLIISLKPMELVCVGEGLSFLEVLSFWLFYVNISSDFTTSLN